MARKNSNARPTPLDFAEMKQQHEQRRATSEKKSHKREHVMHPGDTLPMFAKGGRLTAKVGNTARITGNVAALNEYLKGL